MALISVDELAALLPMSSPDSLAICDVRFDLGDHDAGRRAYDEAHLPGAVFVDLHRDLADTTRVGAGRHPLPNADDFAELLGNLGISPDTHVVAYDDAGGATASRLWWMLRSIGHRQVTVLDGGIEQWRAAELPVESTTPDRIPVEYPLRSDWTSVADADEVDAALAAGDTVVDARAAERYRGEHEPLDSRAGHIPGAINRFHGDAVDGDGMHHHPTELAALFDGVGESPIVYCGSGVTACHTLLAMEEAGITDARLYPGSWSEWSSDDARPVATD